MSRAPLPAPWSAASAASKSPTGGHCCWTKSASSLWRLRLSCCGCFRSRSSSRSAATGPSRVNVRILAASNRDLEKAVHAGRFREDLFYRLNVLSLTVPPLRQRRTDVPQLAMFFLERYAKKFGRRIEGFAASTMERLMNYSWPGNVRELQNVIERAMVLCQDPILDLKQDLLPVLPPRLTPHGSADIFDAGFETAGANPPLPTTKSSPDLLSLDELQRQHILAVLKQTGGVIEGPKGAAGILHLHPNTLRSRMKKLKIERLYHEIS